ncbi:MAG TPA: deoxyribonuclease IV [Chloroflexi bacterium]|nr:deoxyribonuclease IV [Chloroflexota bacterium]
MPLGAHMSISGGVDKAIDRGQEVGCDTIQIFTRTPRQWKMRGFSEEEVEGFRRKREEAGISPVFAHDTYLINLGSPDEELWKRSIAVFEDELARCDALGLPFLVVHPGSHVGQGEEAGLARIAEALSLVLAKKPGYESQIVLEITAGQGHTLGYSFQQLARLIELTEGGERLGICFDTCHAFVAGYEIRTPEGYDTTFDELNELIGLERLKAFHLNDAKGDLGSRLDRHEHIGKGRLGLEPFRMILNDERFRGLPMVLETPKGPKMEKDIENLRVLRSLRG